MSHHPNRRGKKRKLFRVSPSPSPEILRLIDELRARLSTSEEWTFRFQNLYRAIMSAGSGSSSPTKGQKIADLDVDCETCERLLDRYAIDALEGRDPKIEYPLVWDHLQTCDHCQQAYNTLIDLLTSES